MPVVPLPERPDLEQLKKQAKLLRRAVRDGDPKAVAMVAEHHTNAPAGDGCTVAVAQFVLARSYGFASWAKLRRHLATLEPEPEPAPGVLYTLTVENQYHAQPDRAADDDIGRAVALWPEVGDWRPRLTVRRNGVRVIVFDTPDGPRFCELTPTAITLSRLGVADERRATLQFHTPLGTMAGVVVSGVTSLSLERPADNLARDRVVVAGGIFVVPNAFPVTSAGLVFRCDGSRTGDIVAAADLPVRSEPTVDRPRPPADRTSAAGRRLAAAIAVADAPPVVDPDQWSPGVHLALTDTDTIQLGRYENLLGWHRSENDYGLRVCDFLPRRGPVREFGVLGRTISATRVYYDFREHHSDTIAVVGLVHDDRVASITVCPTAKPDVPAVIDGGTFVAPGLAGLSERTTPTRAHIVVRDAAGEVLEDLPYRRSS